MKYGTSSLRSNILNQHTGLGLSVALLLGMGVIACGEDGKGTPSEDAGSDSSGSSDSTASTSGASGTSGSTSGGNGSSGGTGGSGTSSGTGGGSDSLSTSGTQTDSSGPTCSISSLQVFPRSDTEDAWDDNDFSDVTLEGSCPVLVNVTWPHEAGWEDADPSEANQEQIHFTLDSNYTLDLTGKQLNLTIELVEDVRSPEATLGGYEIGLVSVSSYQREEVTPVVPGSSSAVSSSSDVGSSSAEDDAGLVDTDTTGDAALTDVGDVDGGVQDGDASTSSTSSAELMTTIVTGYAEAESPAEERIILRHVGDRATVRFVLPNRAGDGSYDPASVIKINARIYNQFSAPEPEPSEDNDAGVIDAVDAGDGVESSETSSTTSSSAASNSSTSGISSASTASSEVSGFTSSSSESSSSETTAGESTSAPTGPKPRIYGYLTSKFAITDFTVTDAE